MERESFSYKLRRKGQVFVSYVIPDKILCKLYSKIILKKKVNLDNPSTFNEKIQWLKLNNYPQNDLIIRCADKFKVREYIKSKGLEKILVPLLGDWNTPDDIDFNKLPDRFVLKCNHGCAYNIICSDKRKIDRDKTIKTIKKWMREDFGRFNIERHYSKIKPHITCEKFLGEHIIDYKFFCFNGKPTYVYISYDLANDRKAKIGLYDIHGSQLPLKRDDYELFEVNNLPSFFDNMKKDAETLCSDFKFVRVDFFALKNKYYFAELTFTPSGGMMPFNPQEYDKEWGKLICL